MTYILGVRNISPVHLKELAHVISTLYGVCPFLMTLQVNIDYFISSYSRLHYKFWDKCRRGLFITGKWERKLILSFLSGLCLPPWVTYFLYALFEILKLFSITLHWMVIWGFELLTLVSCRWILRIWTLENQPSPVPTFFRPWRKYRCINSGHCIQCNVRPLT